MSDAASAAGEQPGGRRPLAEELHKVTETALSHLGHDDLLAELLERVADMLDVDTAAILLVEEDGETLLVRAAKGLEEEVEGDLRLPMGQGFAGRVAAERRPLAIGELRPGDVVNPVLISGGLRSLLGVPLLVEGRLIGVLHVGTLEPRRFTSDDASLLQVVADRAALAIEHSRLYRAEREARVVAEEALTRIENLHRVTEAALTHLGLEDLLRELLERITGILGTDTAAILLLEEDGATLRARAAKGLEEEVEGEFRLPIGEGFAGRVAAERRPIVIADLRPGLVANPLLIEKGLRSLLGVPLVAENRLIGVLHVGTLRLRTFSDEDIQLLELAAERAALAIERDLLYEQQRVAEALQRMVLPGRFPSVPGLAVSARYLPAAAQAAVGGDWYDVIEIGDGRIGLAIGDVGGHGVQAATFMGQIRYGLRAYSLEGRPPAEVMRKLAHFLESLEPQQIATLLYAVLDPERQRLTLVSAGHPKPLLIQTDGSVSYAEVPVSPPLGVAPHVPYQEHELELPDAVTVLLYTDGLIERRGERLLERHRVLADVAAAAPFDPDLLCGHVLAEMAGDGAMADDVALLATQLVPHSEPQMHITVAARVEELAAIRRLLRRWLERWGASREDVEGLILACGEACANAIEHAYGPGDATFDLEGEHSGDEVRIRIRDSGRWRPARGENRGRGISLMNAFVDSVEITPADDGTTVELMRRLQAQPERRALANP